MSTGATASRMPGLVNLAVRSPAVLLPLLMVTIPLEFTKQYFPTELLEVGRLVMIVIIAAMLVGTLGGHAIRLPAGRLWIPPAIFLGFAGVSAVVTLSVPGLKTLSAALTYAVVGLAIFNWTRTTAGQERVWLFFAVSCIGLATIAIIQRITGLYIWNAPTSAGLARVNATFADPNILGRVLTCMIVAGVALVPAVAGRRTKVVMIAAILMSAASLPFTYSRQAWVIGGATIVLALLASRQRREALLLAAGAVAVFAGVTLLVPEVQARFGVLQQNLTGGPTHIFERPGLAFLNYLPLDSERHYLIAAGLQMFYDHPIFGIGFGGFHDAILGPYSGFILSGYTTSESHTSLVTILAELGLIGLVLAAWWAFEYVRLSIAGMRTDEARRAYILAPLIAVIVILLESQLNARLIDEPYLWVFLGLAWAAMAFDGAPEARASQPKGMTSSAATSQNSTARSFFQ
jgi:putative inorganic carbon (hco3(-)) transporter